MAPVRLRTGRQGHRPSSKVRTGSRYGGRVSEPGLSPSSSCWPPRRRWPGLQLFRTLREGCDSGSGGCHPTKKPCDRIAGLGEARRLRRSAGGESGARPAKSGNRRAPQVYATGWDRAMVRWVSAWASPRAAANGVLRDEAPLPPLQQTVEGNTNDDGSANGDATLRKVRSVRERVNTVRRRGNALVRCAAAAPASRSSPATPDSAAPPGTEPAPASR